MNKRIIILLIGAAFFVATGAVSCSGSTHQSSQAGATDHSPAQVLQMPSGFRNVALKCAFLQGSWYAVASVSDGGNGDNKPGSVAMVASHTCTHDGP